MGNCFSESHKSTAEIAPFDCTRTSAVKSAMEASPSPPASIVRLYGPVASLATSYLRFALLHKKVTVRFFPSHDEKLSLQIGPDTVSGDRERLMRFVEERFKEPPLRMMEFSLDGFDGTTPLVVRVASLHHRSIVCHLERTVDWVEDLSTRGGRKAVDPAAGTPRMEVRKLGNSYSQLLELMLEHAQMEERVIFPVLESVDREICKSANKEHGRELPMMNGIKESIKSIGVLDCGSSVYCEALSDLTARFKSLLERCKEHFAEEETDLLPLMEAAELSRYDQRKLLNQSFDAMRGTHSHLLEFLLEGLLPHEAMQYLDLIIQFRDKEEGNPSLLYPIYE